MDIQNPNPAFGSDLGPIHGIPTFMRLPASRTLDGVDVDAAADGTPQWRKVWSQEDS